MCCFSAQVEVADTNQFARASSGNRQLLVYQMALRAAAPTAMILPLPVPPRSREDAVRFLDLSAYPGFFADLRKPFAGGGSRTRTGGGPSAAELPAPRLAVHRVGSFEASFVPSREDFARLDERFRLPADAWDELPSMRDWGFAVFKLRDVVAGEAATVEPMALDFPRRDRSALFFPAVHIHDRRVHPTARFDHNLFLQADDDGDETVVAIGNHARRAASSNMEARWHTAPDKAAGILDGERPVQVVRFAGVLPNHDAVSAARGPVLPPDAGDFEAWKRSEERLPPAVAARLVARLAAARAAAEVSRASVAASAALVDCMPSAQQGWGYIGGRASWYGAPELLRSGETAGERTEVYEIAAVLYHMTAGRTLFGNGLGAVVGHIQQAPPLLGEHAGLDEVLGRALAKDPAARYPSLRELAAALAAVSSAAPG